MPLHVVAADVESGAPITLSSGPAEPALLASTALPGIFPPVEIDGRLLIDGGIAADTPVHQAEALGATDVLVLGAFSPNGVGPGARGATALGWYAYEQIFAHWSSDLVALPGHRISVVPLPQRDGHGPLDFSAAASRILQSYVLTRSWLQDGAGIPTPGAARLTLVH